MKLGKKRRLPLIGALSFGLLLSTVGVLISSKESKLDEVQGYSTSSLPTTIDLNDTSESNIRSYYSSLNNKSTSERQGNNLLKNLKTILKNGQKYYSYDSGNAIWQIYEIADRDWSKSPASSTSYGTYNSSTNKITNYSYGTSSSSSKNNPYIHALYINRNVTNQTTAWDDHQQTQWGINREHVWPKAEGFETSGAGGARGDPMHLMAGNGYANNIHSNYYYGYVNTSSSYTNCGSKYSNVSGNLLGKSKTLGGSTNVFEPQDCDKGDIARAIFYMVARYNYLSSSDSDGIDSNNPNLALTQSLSDWASSGYSSTTSKQGKMGIMTDLLAWHHADPVDEYEIHRNNLLYTNYTNNRNPFIDFPEWADFIWGSVNYSGSTYVSHSTTPTGYATPSSDTINGYNSGGGETISVTGISVSPSSTSVEAGKDVTITPTITPSNATNQGVSWTTSNSSIATVSGGIVTGVAEGSATITATTSDGGYTATCSVTVTASQGGGGGGGSESAVYTIDTGDNDTATSLATSNSYGNYAQDSGYKWAMNCGSRQGSNGSYNIWLGSNNNQKAKMILSNGGYSEASAIATAIGVTTSATYYAALFQRSGGTAITNVNNVELTYTTPGGTAPSQAWVVYSTNNGSTWQVLDTTTTLSSSGTTFTAQSKISSAIYGFVIHSTGYCQFKAPKLVFNTVTESETSLDSISLDTSDAQTIFTTGDTFSSEGLVVTANYTDGSSDIVVPTSISSPNMSTAGSKTITVSYTEGGVTKTETYTITVNAPSKTLSSITLDTSGVQTAFNVGDTFTYENLQVIAHYSDSTTDYVSPASVSSPDMSSAGSKTITVTYEDKSATYQIQVTAVLTSISLNTDNVTKSFNTGDTFTYSGLVVTAHYNDSTSSTVASGYTVSTPDMSTPGSKTITVTYNEKQATYSITVSNEGSTTASVSIADYASANSWVNGTKYTSVVVDSNITASVSAGTTNTGKYYTSGNEWRFYQGENGAITISCGSQYVIDTVTITYNISNTGILKDSKNNNVTSGESQTVGSSSVTYTVGNTGSATNGQAKITAISVEYHQNEVTPTSITATVDRSYYVGETLTKSDITVVDNNENVVTDFVFEDYMFTYSDAASGGALTSKNFTITYTTFSLSTTLVVQVQRKAYTAPTGSVTDTLTYSMLGISGSGYKEWSGISDPSGSEAVYAGQSNVNNKNYIQLRNTSPSGIISTTSGGTLSSVSVTWNTSTQTGRTITIYGSNTAYSSTTDLYDNSKKGTQLGTIVKDTSTSLTITGSYQYIGILANGALYLDEINISYGSSETPTNVANYIMYTDTNNQCETKYGVAKGYFNNLSAANRAVFMTSEDYVIATARERFLDWAKHHGETITYSNSDYVVGSNPSPINIVTTSTSTTLIIVVIGIVAVGALGGYFYLRRREQK